MHHPRQRVCSRGHHLNRQPQIACSLQTQVEHRCRVCKNANRINRHFVLSEEQLARDKGLHQLRLGLVELTLLNQFDTRSQTTQPHFRIEKATSAHSLPVLIAKTAGVLTPSGRVLVHRKIPLAPEIKIITGIAVTNEAISR